MARTMKVLPKFGQSFIQMDTEELHFQWSFWIYDEKALRAGKTMHEASHVLFRRWFYRSQEPFSGDQIGMFMSRVNAAANVYYNDREKLLDEIDSLCGVYHLESEVVDE